MASFSYHKLFMSRTNSVVRSMQLRFSEKRDKNNRVIRPGRLVPFTVEQFRAHLLKFLGGVEDGVAQCRYCNSWLNIATVACDHAIPVSRGGSLDLTNIEFPCKPCNNRKGKLMPDEFMALLTGLEKWPATARNDVLHRLEIAVQLAAGVRRGITNKRNEAAQEQEDF